MAFPQHEEESIEIYKVIQGIEKDQLTDNTRQLINRVCLNLISHKATLESRIEVIQKWENTPNKKLYLEDEQKALTQLNKDYKALNNL